ncbi:MAG: NAD(P)H-hydrate dehydratase [Sphingomonas sp.]
MIPIDGQAVLTAADTRKAEARAIAAGVSADEMMARAGAAVAEQVRRLAAGAEVLVLCGPGNNGGDGYVAAAALRRAGLPVRVATFAPATTPQARAARERWGEEVEALAEALPAPILVDAIFGIGLSRALDEGVSGPLRRLMTAARLTIAVDVPSGVSTDDGVCLSDLPPANLTLAMGAVKPAHLLQPAAAQCGTVRFVDIGLEAPSRVRAAAAPVIEPPAASAHKYSRGMVAVVAGAMPGAGALAASAAARAGAGYVLLLGSATDRLPHAIVRRRFTAEALEDHRIGAVVIGPGLGRDERAEERLVGSLASGRPLVIDGDALRLMDDRRCAGAAILTPHAGEFDAMFGRGSGSKIDRTVAAAEGTGAVVVHKGPDTVIAAPDGRVIVHSGSSSWLSTAGTGDVLAGVIGARLAAGLEPMEAAVQGVWLHAEAARRAGAAFIADDLVGHLTLTA